MKQRILWIFIALLATTCAAQGYYIHNQQRPQSAETFLREDEWLRQARKRMLEGGQIPFKDFDELFDDRLFGGRLDPFAEMRELQKHFNSQLWQDRKPFFSQSWDDWFSGRMDLSSVAVKTKETDKEVVVELHVPNLDKDSLNIDVNKSRIRVAYDAKDTRSSKDASGREYFRSESTRHFEKLMPVPENADGASSRIEREGNVVKIIFQRRQHGVKADA
jgi:HSP20 family molecular chaperone IbpA